MKRTAFITRKVLALVSRSGTACTAWLGAALFVPPAKSSCAAAFRGSRRRRARATIGDSYLSCVIAFVVSLCLIGVAEARAAVTQRTECSHLDPSQCALVTEYPIPPPPQYSTNPGGIAPGPDGRMWFTENAGAAQGIGAITPSGQITQYTIPTGGSHPGSIVAGPDGRMWFSEDLTNKIGAVTTTGQFTEYPLPGGSVGPYDLAVGSDGRLWFTEEAVYGKSDEGGDFIGAITTAGQITIYPVFAMPGGLTEGADGRIWFLDENGNIDAVATDGTVTAYPLPEAFHETVDITAGSDGRLWITNIGGVAAVTTTGVVTVYYDSSVPLVGRQDPNSSGAWIISSGPDGRMWYFDLGQDRLSAMTTSGVQSGVFLPIGVDPQTAGGSALATAPLGSPSYGRGLREALVHRRIPRRRDRRRYSEREPPNQRPRHKLSPPLAGVRRTQNHRAQSPAGQKTAGQSPLHARPGLQEEEPQASLADHLPTPHGRLPARQRQSRNRASQQTLSGRDWARDIPTYGRPLRVGILDLSAATAGRGSHNSAADRRAISPGRHPRGAPDRID